MQAEQPFPGSNETPKSFPIDDNDICRDFLRNVCKRGKKCKYKHPAVAPTIESSREPIFCHDYQNGVCHRTSCKFLHFTKREEVYYRLQGSTPLLQMPENHCLATEVPVCKDFLNHNCHRGSSCKFLHGKLASSPSTSSMDNPSNKPPMYHSLAPSSYSAHTSQLSRQHVQFSDGNGSTISPPRTSESAVTTPETTAMVAAAAAAGYLAMQKHGQQQQHQHGAGVQGSSPVTPLSTSALPPASAAAVAAAAAATALATTQHHQQQHAPLNQRYSETALSDPQTTGIPVMQTILGAVTNPSVLHSRSSGDSAYSSPTPLSSTVLPNEITCQYYQGNGGTRNSRNSHFCVKPDDQVSVPIDFNLPSLANHSTKAANCVKSDVLKKPINSHSSLGQHSQQQQDANTAAAVAAAACFGAILSQPVAAAAAASHVAVSKPTAGELLSQAVGGDCTLSSIAASPAAIVTQPPSSGVTPPAPPPTAVAAAAAAAVAAAVVSSAGPSAAVAAISAAHLASSSLTHAHSATYVSCSPTGTSSALPVNGSRFVTNMKTSPAIDSIGVGGRHRRVCGPNETRVDMYGPDETMSLHLNMSPSPPAAPSVMPTIGAAAAATPPLGSSAATAAYTATMTTAAAAAAMAAAVAVEEHNQKKNAAAAAMAAFNESAALAHGVPSITRITDHAPLSPESLPSSSLTAATKSSLSEASTIYPLPTGKPVSHGRMRVPHNRHRAHFSAFDLVDDESYEESYYDDEDDEGDEISGTAINSHQNDRKCSRVGRSCSPDHTFGRSRPIVDKPRQRSLSYPACTPRSEHNSGKVNTERLTNVSDASLIPLSPQVSCINPAMAPPHVYRGCGIPSKRPKLVSRDNGHVVSPTSSTYAHRRYNHFPRQIRHIDVESEMDDDEEFCYTEFYSPASVVAPPSYRERIRALKRENTRLRLHLQRVIQQRNQLQIENHTLVKQNLKLRKFGSSIKRINLFSGSMSMKQPPSFLPAESKQRLLQPPSSCRQSTPSAPSCKQSVTRNSYQPQQ